MNIHLVETPDGMSDYLSLMHYKILIYYKEWRYYFMYVTIGRFTIQTDILAAFLALLTAALLFRLKEKRSISDWYWNSFFLYIIVSKFSYALFNFNLFIDTPLSILYFNGGTKGQILAFVSLGIYLWMIARKNKDIIVTDYIPIYIMFFILYEGLQFGFEQMYIAAILHIVLLAGFYYTYFKNTSYSPIHSKQAFILVLLIESILISIFDNVLQTDKLMMLLLGITVLLLQYLVRRNN
jgi:hypothetical protein